MGVGGWVCVCLCWSAETRVLLLCTSVGNFHRARKLTWCEPYCYWFPTIPLHRTHVVSPVCVCVNLNCDWPPSVCITSPTLGKHEWVHRWILWSSLPRGKQWTFSLIGLLSHGTLFYHKPCKVKTLCFNLSQNLVLREYSKDCVCVVGDV